MSKKMIFHSCALNKYKGQSSGHVITLQVILLLDA